MAGFNLKSIFTADTQDLKKGAAEAKQAVKDFDDATTSALDEVTGLFGTSMGQISKTLSTVKGGFLSLSGAINKTTQSATLGSKALNVLKIAIASTGVGALVVALGSLVAYFTKTQRGADLISRVMGQVGQVFKTVTDYAILLGEKIFKAFTNPLDAVKNFWKVLSNKEERQKLIKDLANIGKDFEDRQKRRLELDKKLQEFRDKEGQFNLNQAKKQEEINKLKLQADDRLNYSEQERLEFTKQYQKLIREQYAEAIARAEEELALLKEENALSESMTKDTLAEKNLQAYIVKLQSDLNQQLKETVTKEAEITGQIQAQADAKEKQRLADLKEKKKKDLTLKKVDSADVREILDVKAFGLDKKKPAIKTEELKELKTFMLDTADIAREFSNTISDAFATMVEGLTSGELNMKDIFSSVLQFLAENLKAIGKALIAYGTAMEGFKKAFSNPWAAIAAGSALIAAGAVLSGLIKRASSGGSSASASYATATSVGAGGTLDLTSQTQWQQKSQEVKVTGTIKASGRDLAVVLENENKRKNYTT